MRKQFLLIRPSDTTRHTGDALGYVHLQRICFNLTVETWAIFFFIRNSKKDLFFPVELLQHPFPPCEKQTHTEKERVFALAPSRTIGDFSHYPSCCDSILFTNDHRLPNLCLSNKTLYSNNFSFERQYFKQVINLRCSGWPRVDMWGSAFRCPPAPALPTSPALSPEISRLL